MTEKRFTNQRTDDYNYSDILDNGEWIGICHVDCEDDFVDKLNELHEDLKHELTVSKALRDVVRELEKENEQLKEENEQLKHRLDDWHQRTFKAHEYFNILEKVIDEVCDDDVSNKIWKEYEKREKVVE